MTVFRSPTPHNTHGTPTSSGDRSSRDTDGSRTTRLVRAGAAAIGFVVFGSALAWGLAVGVTGFVLIGVVLFGCFEVVVRRRPVRVLWARDSTTFARTWRGRLVAITILLAVPALMIARSYAADRWIDDSWTVLLMAAVLVSGYLVSQRLLVSLLVASVLVAVVMWTVAPRLAGDRQGDPRVLAQIASQQRLGMLSGQQDLAVAEVEPGSVTPVRLATVGADLTPTTPMEVGSLTKAMTGLVVADSIRRGELGWNEPVATHLPDLEGVRAGKITIGELVTHTGGYANFGTASTYRALWSAPLGRGFLEGSRAQLMSDARNGHLTARGTYVYSSLGAAVVGQAAAAAAGVSYPDLMRTRLFAPLGMTDTALQTRSALVTGGHSPSGLPVRPWFFDAEGYAPAGAVVSTARDLSTLATAILNGTAPGLDALTETSTAVPNQGKTHVGNLWRVSTWGTGQTITWHDGLTAGYASYFGLDRERGRAVIVLSDVGNPATTDLGINLLADSR